MTAIPVIHVSPNASVRLQKFADDVTCAVVDDFLENPEEIVSAMASEGDRFVTQPLGHPSIGPSVGESQIQEILRFARSTLSKHLPFHRSGMQYRAFLSNVSLRPEELTGFHRMCHIDPRQRPDHLIYAGVIYLFQNPELGGTGFYRWKAKDIAIRAYQLSREDPAAALRYLEEVSETYRKPPEYMTASNDIAEFLGAVPAKFNRMVFYNGEIPHSGHITRPDLLDRDPAKGRLVLNVFLSVKPKEVA